MDTSPLLLPSLVWAVLAPLFPPPSGPSPCALVVLEKGGPQPGFGLM